MSGVELYDGDRRKTRQDRSTRRDDQDRRSVLNLQRNINLKDLKIHGFEAWVTFDEQGRQLSHNLRIPPPEPNKRILFAYSTATVEIKNGVIHYGDARHEISGTARNLEATGQPDDPNAPAESWMNTVTMNLTDSNFIYDGRPINDIDIHARGRVDQTRAEIHEIVLRSPVAEARLQGTMDDWRALRYQLQITSSVDLTQISETFRPGMTLRGAAISRAPSLAKAISSKSTVK